MAETNPMAPTNPAATNPAAPNPTAPTTPVAQTHPLVTPPPSEPEVYRPISPLAVAGLCLGGIYGALVLVTTVVALFRGAPFFLPAWMIILPIAGAIVSYLGLRHIANSEGTRAGATLARWGLWLSVVTGLTYGSYLFFTGHALKNQADDFLLVKSDDDSGFFPRLIEGTPEQINRAFLLTLPYGRRQGHDPANAARLARDFGETEDSELQVFRDSLLVRALAGKAGASVEALGVQEWKREQGSYHVLRNYRLNTREMTVEVLVPVYSTEGDDSDGRRKWFVAFQRMRPQPPQWTVLGTALRQARDHSRSAMDKALAEAKRLKELRDDTDYERVFPKDWPVAALKEKLLSILTNEDPLRMQARFMPIEDSPLDWQELPDGRLRLAHEASLTVEMVRDIPSLQPFKCRIRFWVETTAPFDPQSSQQAPTWQATRYEIISVAGPPKIMKK